EDQVRADTQGRPKITVVERLVALCKDDSRPLAHDLAALGQTQTARTLSGRDQHGGRYSVFAETHEWYVDRTHE
ncbi:MAG: hypothetical protein HC853_09785, partial [Anaerolineae bacterium]|nr:hypothetical protein [Anaerolineae bacterium]